MSSSAPVRSGYHHGDLRNALIEAAAGLAADGGPGAVTIRAAARAVGVTPTAAYRHFAGHEQLLDAAKDEAMVRMNDSMRAELAQRTPSADRIAAALGDLAAIARGYLNFALAQPGLFRTAFCSEGHVLPPPDQQAEYSPFRTLVGALDELAAAGYLPPERRPMAEFGAWSMAHGLAMLLLDGPLRELDAETREEIVVRSLVIFAEGLGGGGLTDELRDVVVAAARE
ncbi:TetR family transcriptional regulator [Prauserella sp. PE36]|uniref:TetR/AcrR family transcriptional regulator n=1 Tax=Prauserella endophytica TaxID=1592324 RepID=A0ABY2S744_9PSEU|nr:MULTISPECIES: TetR-like C-terminal domain-containing protein [Prauserella]PXY30212.1 transcriptional regulator [Prauserella coralliicola]RBM22669.1 TetR family transcriptional regulator [Prauserella sp. PE36]TKG71281.1 TetR/AcrR family transcriptional regulator [Prauserella endophytica]